MKIGIVCPYDIGRGGGVQEHVLAQAAELRSRGHTVKILTPKVRKTSQTTKHKDIIYVGNATKVRTPIKTSLELGASLRRDELDDILSQQKFDVLHIHEPEIPVLGAQIVSKAICPVVATFHAIHPETPMGRTINTFRIPYSRSIFSKLDELTAVSEPAAKFVKNRTGRQVTIIPNGIDLDRYKFAPSTTSSKTILYIGRLEKRKGVIYLLKAYQQLSKQRDELTLNLVGDGELKRSLKEYVKTHKIPRVNFLGYVDDATKLDLLHRATVFCSPALYGESFGIVLLEAMASGTVTVAGNNEGYSSVLTGVGTESLVDPKNASQFAAKLAVMLDDQSARRRWQKWAKSYVKKFSYKEVVDQYMTLYNKVNKQKDHN